MQNGCDCDVEEFLYQARLQYFYLNVISGHQRYQQSSLKQNPRNI